MLKPIDDPALDLTAVERLAAAFRGWDAVDPVTGAFLSRCQGHRGYGCAPRWVLVVPSRPAHERGGLLAPYRWDYPGGRTIIEAWTNAQALCLANQRLAELAAEMAEAATPEIENAHANPSLLSQRSPRSPWPDRQDRLRLCGEKIVNPPANTKPQAG